METGSDRTGISGCVVTGGSMSSGASLPPISRCGYTHPTLLRTRSDEFMNLFTAEDYERLVDQAPYGFFEDPMGTGNLYRYQNPAWEPARIGNFQDYFRAEYHDWVIGTVRQAVEEEGMDIHRYSSTVPEYDQVFLEDPEILSVKTREVMPPWKTFGEADCNTTIQVDAVVTSDVILYESVDRRSDHSSQWFRVRTYLDLLSGDVSFPVVSVYQRERDPAGRLLSDELYPVILKEQLESEADLILARYYPEALDDPGKLRGEELAHRLGLKICYAGLGDSEHHYGRLYFDRQDVEVFDAVGNPEVITVMPKTILLDTGLQGKSRAVTRKREDAILHECVHFIEHACFFYFQKLHHEELAFLASDGPVKVFHGEETPIDRVERQACQITARLRMPQAYTRRKIRECMKKYQYLKKTEAMNRTVHDLSCYLNVSYDMARYRMTELGYPEARGVMNFIDGRYVDDYAADGGDRRRYAVTLEQLDREYQRNPKLRQLAETGEYVYVGGYLVRFSPESVRLENGKYRLTSTAQMNISRYCIGFVPCHIGKHCDYDPDALHLDHNAHPDDLRMDEHQDLSGLMKLDCVYHQTVSERTAGFAENLTGLMDQLKITVPVLVEDTGISERTIKNYRNGKSAPTLEYIISICVAMGLSSWTSRNLLKSAHFTFDASEGQPYEAYSFIIDYMTVDYSVMEVNEYLRKKGIPPLSMPNTK